MSVFGYLVRAAAQRLVCYWGIRQDAFGDKWLLPMSDTGEGAMDEDDCTVLRSGWITVVMSPPNSPFRMPVIYIDDNKVQGDPIDEKMRTLFYVFTILGGDKSVQRDGVILIQNKMSEKVVSIPSMMMQLEVVQRALPVSISKFVVVKSNNVERGSLSDMAHTRLFQHGLRLFGAAATHLIVSDTIANVANVFTSELAIPPTSIPVELGGQWTVDQLMEWRVRVGVAVQASDPPPSSSVLRARASSHDATEEGGESSQDEERMRLRNALYARRAYRKKKTKETELEQQARELEAERDRLLAQQRQLEYLMEQAVAIVNVHNTSGEAAAAAEDAKRHNFSRDMFDRDPLV